MTTLVVLPLLVLWPAAIGLALLDGRRRAVGSAAVAVLLATTVLLAALLARVATDGPQEVVAGGWPAEIGIRLRVDLLGAVFAVLSCGVLAAALLQAVSAGIRSRIMPALTVLMALGLTGLFAKGPEPSVIMTPEGLRLKTPHGWFALPYDGIQNLDDHPRGFVFAVPPPYHTVAVERSAAPAR